MLDLATILKQDSGKSSGVKAQQEVVCFYQTAECKSLVTEASNFEGIVPPQFLELKKDTLKQLTNNEQVEIVILELNESEDVSKEAEKFSHYLPNQASVVVIGKEDSISTIRNLKSLGFYYLFWPVNKQEYIDFFASVKENRERSAGISKSRKAKQISFIGCKGGVGTTLLCAETASYFANKKNMSSVVVDNAYQGGNLDIMLGYEKFEKRDVRPGSMAVNLDETSAQALLKKQTPMLSVLSLTSSDLENTDLKDYTKTVAGYVSQSYNFVFEDVSANASMIYSKRDLIDISDCIVLVFTPTVSALRDAAKIKKSLSSTIGEESPLRIITVLNYTQPEANASINHEDVEKYLDCQVDVVIPFVKKLDQQVLTGKGIVAQRNKASKAIEQLSALILGEQKKRKLFSFG
ncbi:AAA family ATPase [Vibrio ulleungensis]|uniref:Type II secretion system protein Z n=1 Tax=Vibrio ulleungensis TaxID=2807619 RepID=A0ABS2HQQ2_9VIBR|nr:type II secretion system protein Z [Vibrio ulleungensis]MBM7038384.1 type II secretion system protein Z [Vibrio ulleungensis]